jgi:hypothetical protein
MGTLTIPLESRMHMERGHSSNALEIKTNKLVDFCWTTKGKNTSQQHPLAKDTMALRIPLEGGGAYAFCDVRKRI